MISKAQKSEEDFLAQGAYVCIIAAMRTGSNLLQSYLNMVPGITCLGEIFNPAFVGVDRPDVNRWMFSGFRKTDVVERDADRVRFYNRLYVDAKPNILAFRIFDKHDEVALKKVINNKNCKKIILRRDFLQSFVSLEIARKTDQWLLLNESRKRKEKIVFDEEAFLKYEEEMDEFYSLVEADIRASKQECFAISYTELKNLDRVNALISYLDLGYRFDKLQEKLLRQNPEGLEEKVDNYSQLKAFLDRRGKS